MALAVGKIVGDGSDDIAYSLFDSGKIVSPLRFPQQTDVTSMVSVSYYGTQYNRTTKTTSFYAKITNTSSKPLNGPIYLAIANLTPVERHRQESRRHAGRWHALLRPDLPGRRRQHPLAR